MRIAPGNHAFADNLAIISLTPDHLQNLHDIVYRYTYKWKLDINCKKSTIVVFNNDKKSFPQQFIFGDFYIQQSDAAVHLGIRQDSNHSLFVFFVR